jgi:hypothetical protein
MTSYLDEIEQRAMSATPGPWDVRCREFSNTELPRNIWANYGWIAKTEGLSQEANADFIAHAREDIPILVKRLRMAIEVIRQINKCHLLGWEEMPELLERAPTGEK